MGKKGKEMPFIYGSQYYRAPTPERRYWRKDLEGMSGAGFNMIKFWVQWRWTHRQEDEFYFEDIDSLMDLAEEYHLPVTINVIFDVAPDWIFKKYPDSLMRTVQGVNLSPTATRCRQAGGYPGPCFSHSGARKARKIFIRETVKRYASHPALSMWDVWNEPESNMLSRTAKKETLVCYCDNCNANFKKWLKAKYEDIRRLNDVWGRCYKDWEEIEMPKEPATFTDMIDWRLFHLDSLGNEAKSRIRWVKTIDSKHSVYLHPVPNVLKGGFNSVTGADDFQIASGCDCYGGTVVLGIPNVTQIVSAAQGRIAYNVESHLCAGGTNMYPKILSADDFISQFVPQMGAGIRGFLHWQYRSETLGSEAPGWGLLDIYGKAGSTHKGAVEFWEKLKPFAEKLVRAPAETPQIGIYKSRHNELFHWCMHGDFRELGNSVNNYTEFLYKKSYRIGYVNSDMLVEGLKKGIKLLIMPNCYALTEPEAAALTGWVKAGGTVIMEAHTGSYNLTTGRHTTVTPGLGMAESFGIYETSATAVNHMDIALKSLEEGPGVDRESDLWKALEATGLSQNSVLPLNTVSGRQILGWSRYAEIEGEDIEKIASVPGKGPAIARKRYGKGFVYLFGTLAGLFLGSRNNLKGWEEIIGMAAESAGIIRKIRPPEGLRYDIIRTEEGNAFSLYNSNDEKEEITLSFEEDMYSVFGGRLLTMNVKHTIAFGAGKADLIVPDGWRRN